MNAGVQELGPTSIAFAGHKQGTELKVEQLGLLELLPRWDADTAGGRLTN